MKHLSSLDTTEQQLLSGTIGLHIHYYNTSSKSLLRRLAAPFRRHRKSAGVQGPSELSRALKLVKSCNFWSGGCSCSVDKVRRLPRRLPPAALFCPITTPYAIQRVAVATQHMDSSKIKPYQVGQQIAGHQSPRRKQRRGGPSSAAQSLGPTQCMNSLKTNKQAQLHY